MESDTISNRTVGQKATLGMQPIFFSGSSKDSAYIEAVWDHLPDDWAYFYTKSGEEGVHMWNEIKEDRLRNSRLLVIFWSKHFPASEGCVEEIIRAEELLNHGNFRPLVIRVDDFNLTSSTYADEAEEKTFAALKKMLDYRTSRENLPIDQAIQLIQRVAEPILNSSHPMLPRRELETALSKTLPIARFEYAPAVWISGFNGVGRQTFVTEYVRRFNPNAKCYVIEIDESSLAQQIQSRLESTAFGASAKRLTEIATSDEEKAIFEICNAIEQISLEANFVIFRHSRIVEESVDLPEWLDEVFQGLTPGTRPKTFVISQVPLLGDRKASAKGKLKSQRVPTIDSHILQEFAPELIAHFDNNPSRWTDEEIQKLVEAAGGTIGFLISLISAASTMEDFEEIDQLVVNDSENRTASLTAYVRWAFSQLRGHDDELKTLAFLNDISPCDLIDLEKAVSPEKSILRIIGKLLNLGLVERENEGIYRLTPLLSRRMSRDLLRPDILVWLRDRLKHYLNEPIEADVDDDQYIRIESRIQASMLSGEEDVPESLRTFVSASHWFHAGIRLYHARRREPAYRILKKAFQKREEFRLHTRVEVTRYFGLSATRNRKYSDTRACIAILNQIHSTKSMAAFLEADMFEHQRKFVEAIREYERSLELDTTKEGRLERTYRPLIRCILFSPRPDYALAERYARRWLGIRETGFSLAALARVYLHWVHRGPLYGREVPKNIPKAYNDAFEDLAGYPGIGSAPFEIKAEEAEFEGDFRLALDFMDRAIETDPRFELRSERWRIMVRSNDQAVVKQALEELAAAKYDPAFESNWVPFLPNLAQTYAIGLKSLHLPFGSLNEFATELDNTEIAEIVRKARRGR